MQGIFSRLHSLLMPSLNSSFLLLMASFTCDHVTDNVVLNLTRRMIKVVFEVLLKADFWLKLMMDARQDCVVRQKWVLLMGQQSIV